MLKDVSNSFTKGFAFIWWQEPKKGHRGLRKDELFMNFHVFAFINYALTSGYAQKALGVGLNVILKS